MGRRESVVTFTVDGSLVPAVGLVIAASLAKSRSAAEASWTRMLRSRRIIRSHQIDVNTLLSPWNARSFSGAV
ncbi:uncharacterized protein P884DRAFT_260793 [Thermothelomyces heterothallicus CBS 202.75]|uniref:uncharacterized protein n=1 Tax=Thermothelomyces heterothallicus CBS 202.75 TaxID=1149848 RepID=UPI003743014E